MPDFTNHAQDRGFPSTLLGAQAPPASPSRNSATSANDHSAAQPDGDADAACDLAAAWLSASASPAPARTAGESPSPGPWLRQCRRSCRTSAGRRSLLRSASAERCASSRARDRSAGPECSHKVRSCPRRIETRCRPAEFVRRPWPRACASPARPTRARPDTRPINCLSLVASAWQSSTITFTSAGMLASTRSDAAKGQSTGRMKTRPSRLNTPTCTPLRAVTTASSRPAASEGKFAGLTMFDS